MSKPRPIALYRDAMKTTLTRVLTKHGQAVVINDPTVPPEVAEFFGSEAPRLALFQTRITSNLRIETRFIKKWTDIAFSMLDVEDEQRLAEVADQDIAGPLLTGIRWLIEINLMHLYDKSLYRTDANWEFTHPAEKLFCSARKELEQPNLWGMEFSYILAALRTSHLLRVAKGDAEFARSLLISDGTWISAKQFQPIAQRMWEAGMACSRMKPGSRKELQQERLLKEVGYWFSTHREKEMPYRERLEKLVVLHVEAILASQMGTSVLSAVNQLHSKRAAFHLPKETRPYKSKMSKYDKEILEERRRLGLLVSGSLVDEDNPATLQKYAYGGTDRNRARFFGTLKEHPLGRAFDLSAPYRFWPSEEEESTPVTQPISKQKSKPRCHNRHSQ